MELTDALERSVAGMREGQTIALHSVATFPWEQVMLIGPYTAEKSVASALGGKVPEALRRVAIETRDDLSVLVFVHAKQVVGVSTIPRHLLATSKQHSLKPISRADARLVLGPERSLSLTTSD